MNHSISNAGLGDVNARFNVYIANRPDFADFKNLSFVYALANDEIAAIGNHCGNGWRKVFNVYAKLIFALKKQSLAPIKCCTSWQQYRDNYLLQPDSNTSLLFTQPKPTSEGVHIVMGKAYAKSLRFELHWLDNDFAINTKYQLIVCPYFDYRQLSNIKIIR